MRKYFLILLLLCSGLATSAEPTNTLTGRSQMKARDLIDAAVAAIGGAEALRDRDVGCDSRRNLAAAADAHCRAAVRVGHSRKRCCWT